MKATLREEVVDVDDMEDEGVSPIGCYGRPDEKEFVGEGREDWRASGEGVGWKRWQL